MSKPIAIVINNNQPGWTNIVETPPNVTLMINTELFTQEQLDEEVLDVLHHLLNLQEQEVVIDSPSRHIINGQGREEIERMIKDIEATKQGADNEHS